MRAATFLSLSLALLTWTSHAAEDDPLAEARRHHELRDHDKAEEALLIRLVDDRKDVEAMKLLADVYLVSERPRDAELIVLRALALAPEDPALTAALWEVRIAKAGFTTKARKEVEGLVDAFLEAAGEDAPVWKLTAAYTGYDLAGAKAKKASLVQRLLAAGTDSPPEVVEGDLFEAIIVERDVDRRVDVIHQFLALFPESSQANFVREILLYTLREDRDRLVAEADGILVPAPMNRRVRASLGRWLLEGETPDPERAREEVRAALKLLLTPEEADRPQMASDEDWERMLHETRGKYLAYLGRAELLLRDAAAAVESLTEALEILPGNRSANLWRGEALEALGRRDDAVEAYARSVAAGDSPEAEARLREILPPGSLLRRRLGEILGPSPRFVDATGAAGLGGVKAGRVSLADVNGDGYPDLLLNGSRLYLSRKGRSFERSGGLPAVPGARGGIFADLDLDGDLDLFVFRTLHPVVLEGDGEGGFKERTPAGMKLPGRHLTEGAAVLDFDGDGNLDLYLANYERPPTPPWARGTHDVLLRNLGGFEFEVASERVRGLSVEPMCGRGATPLDLDDDGDTDLYVANYRLDPDFLLVNRGNEGLVNEARARNVEGDCDKGYFGHGIGPAAGDLNGDGHLDLVVGNLAHPRYIGFSDVTRVFLSSGPPDYTFSDVFRESGIRYEETHSNASLGDVDLDGDLDLYLTSIYRGRKSFLYLNDGEARFTDATWLAGVRADNGWGSAFGDLDLDGDLDLVVASGSGMRLYRNHGPCGGFVGLTLAGGEGTNGSGIGARVTLEGAGKALVREVGGGTGTGCQDDPSLRIGVGRSEGPFILTVRWPSGIIQRILGVRRNTLYRLVEGGNLESVK